MSVSRRSPSLMDRLLNACAGIDQPQSVGVDRIIDDIEELLNTCCVSDDASLDEHPELETSLLRYGSPPPTSLAIASHTERLATARQLQKVLQRFEPRLSRVRVRVEQPKATNNVGRFEIDAAVEGHGQLSLPIEVRNSSGRTQVTTDRS